MRSIVLYSALLASCQAQNFSNTVVSIPYEYTYLLPGGYSFDLNSTFVNGTSTTDATINSLLSSASKAPFISYDAEFTALLGANPQITRVAYEPGIDFAHEVGLWLPTQNTVLFSTAGNQAPAHLNVLDLTTNTISVLNSTPAIINPNGGYLLDGLAYFCTFESNTTYRGGVVSYNPATNRVQSVVNSYFGLPFNGLDDIVGIHRGNQRFLYFTDLAFVTGNTNYTNLPPPQLPAAVWRFDLALNILLPVISRTDIPTPNGIRVSPDFSTLYVTDSGGTLDTPAQLTQLGGLWAAPAIYAYDLNPAGFPVNRRLFGYARTGIADGLHVDDAGRVWTGEGEGVVVRSPTGKVLGVFNSQFFTAGNTPGAPALANFALAGDVLVVLGTQQVWTVKLAQAVVAKDSALAD